MDATATPRGISLAVGELGARGRPINKQCTAVRISSAVNGDMCGTCQGWLAFCPVCRPLRETDARNPRLLFRFACCVHASELLASSGAPGELLVALGLGRIVKRAGGLVDDLL